MGSYHEGTVVAEYRINNSYAICYKKLLTEDESHALIEVVGEDELRPAPPKVHINIIRQNMIIISLFHSRWLMLLITMVGVSERLLASKDHQSTMSFLMFMGLRFRILLLC